MRHWALLLVALVAAALAGAAAVATEADPLYSADLDGFDDDDDDNDDDDDGGDNDKGKALPVDEVPAQAGLDLGRMNVHVAYCVSCGYRNNFVSLQSFLEEHYPVLRGHVTGGEMPLTSRAQVLQTVAQVLQAAGTVFAFFGEPIVFALGLDHPVLTNLLQRRVLILGVIFLFGSSVQNDGKSGAFEVYIQGHKVFSKLETGRLPSLEDVVNALDHHGLPVPAQFNAHSFAQPQRA